VILRGWLRTRWRLRAIATAAPVLVLACGGGGGLAADSGSGGLPPGCADIVVSAKMLGEPATWAMVNVLASAAWGGDGAIHVGWAADKALPSAGSGSRAWFVIGSFDPRSGEQVDQRLYDVFPPEITSDDVSFHAVGGSPDGTFAVGYKWLLDPTTLSDEMLLIGRVGEDAPVAKVVLATSGAEAAKQVQTQVAWDGEAFAVHAYGSAADQLGYNLYVARVGLDGSLILPYTKYGITGASANSEYGHKTTTDPEGGHSYAFEVGWLAGHDRQGVAIAGTEAGGKEVAAAGMPGTATGLPAARAMAGGLWVGFQQLVQGRLPVIQRLDTDGDPAGNAASLPRFPPGDDAGIRPVTFVPRGDRVLAIGMSPMGVYAFEYDGETVGPAMLLMDNGGIREPWMDMRNFSAFRWNDEDWIAFSESRQDMPLVMHVLKVAEGCTYHSATVPE
jgi:hypothetical protein